MFNSFFFVFLNQIIINVEIKIKQLYTSKKLQYCNNIIYKLHPKALTNNIMTLKHWKNEIISRTELVLLVSKTKEGWGK